MTTETDKISAMSTQLTQRSELVRDELIELEKQFNLKKEEFFKIQGALEALQIVSNPEEKIKDIEDD